MGISGLLPMLKPITVRTNVDRFRGQTAAIDAYCWLHKGTYCCSTSICMEGDNSMCIRYCMNRIHMLRSKGVKPLVVFDGGYLPMKSGTEQERRLNRQKYLAIGKKLYEEGKQRDAEQAFNKAVDVSPEMALDFIQVLKSYGVDYVVAPYEADAQMAYLALNGHVDFVISEDSDCIPFGCSSVFFKMDKFGDGDLVDTRLFLEKRELRLNTFTPDMIVDMCILAGCDYLPSLHGMGVKKAHRFVYQNRHTKSILRRVRLDGSFIVPPDYEEKFYRARFTFLHQQVFAYKSDKPGNIPLRPFEEKSFVLLRESDRNLEFAGPPLEVEVACDIAKGVLNPITKEPFPEAETAALKGHEKQGVLGFNKKPTAVHEDFVLKPPKTKQTLINKIFVNKPADSPTQNKQPLEERAITKESSYFRAQTGKENKDRFPGLSKNIKSTRTVQKKIGLSAWMTGNRKQEKPSLLCAVERKYTSCKRVTVVKEMQHANSPRDERKQNETVQPIEIIDEEEDVEIIDEEDIEHGAKRLRANLDYKFGPKKATNPFSAFSFAGDANFSLKPSPFKIKRNKR